MGRLLALAALLCLFAGAAMADTVKEDRSVGAFDKIDLRAAATLLITVGPSPSLSIEGQGDVVKRITTKVAESQLVIDYEAPWYAWPNYRAPTILVTLPRLAALRLSGAGDISVKGLAGGRTDLDLNGAGNLKAEGRLDQLNLSVNGTGNADLSQVPVDRASIVVNGAGSVQVKPAKALNATVNGVGTIVYDGAPAEISSTINGVGSIHRK